MQVGTTEMCFNVSCKKNWFFSFALWKMWCIDNSNIFFLYSCYLLTLSVLEFDRHELQIYEEVARMPPFQRKTLILIGAQGVGRRSLKNRLIVLNPLLFGTTVPCRFYNCCWSACLTHKIFLSANLVFLYVSRYCGEILKYCFLFPISHVSTATWRREGRTVLLLCVQNRDGDGH